MFVHARLDFKRRVHAIVATCVEVALETHATSTFVLVARHPEGFVAQRHEALGEDVREVRLERRAAQTMSQRHAISDVAEVDQ